MTTSLARGTSGHKVERTCRASYRNRLRTGMMDLTLTQVPSPPLVSTQPRHPVHECQFLIPGLSGLGAESMLQNRRDHESGEPSRSEGYLSRSASTSAASTVMSRTCV